jgi:DNA-directed RNA polymerase specialized sigma24 family protein
MRRRARFACYCLRGPADAEDAVQECDLRAHAIELPSRGCSVFGVA